MKISHLGSLWNFHLALYEINLIFEASFTRELLPHNIVIEIICYQMGEGKGNRISVVLYNDLICYMENITLLKYTKK